MCELPKFVPLVVHAVHVFFLNKYYVVVDEKPVCANGSQTVCDHMNRFCFI